MKWNKAYLNSLKDKQFTYSENIDFSSEIIPNCINAGIIHVEGSAKYDSYNESLMLDLDVSGNLTLPCARTLQPVEYKINTNQQVEYSFVESSNEDAIIVNGLVIDTFEIIREIIISEIPIAVYKEGTSQIVPEETKEIDPRLAKLKDLLK